MVAHTYQPVIAILSDPPIRHTGEYYFSSYDDFYKSLCEHAQASGFHPYITTLKALVEAIRPLRPGPIHKMSHEVSGYAWSGERMLKRTFPLPDLIYNRLTRRLIEKSPSFLYLLRWASENNIIFLHTPYIHKWQMIQVLKASPASFYLPPTERYTEKALLNFLQRYPALFIKPALGSLGRSILYLRRAHGKQDKPRYTLQKSEHPETVYTFEDEPSLLSWLKKHAPRRQKIIQPDLALARFEGRPLDFRVHLVRIKPNLFRAVSTIARLGPPGHVVTNVARGGEIIPARLALERLKASYPDWPRDLHVKHLKEIARLIVESYVRAVDLPAMPLVELGVDLAVDERGSIYLLEINGKPSKTPESLVRTEPRPSTRALVRAFRSFYEARSAKED